MTIQGSDREITFRGANSQRAQKAVQIAGNEAKGSFSADGRYAFVASQTDPTRHYKVDLDEERCSCPDSVYRKAQCKHILAAKIVSLSRELAG